jgi:hypothetical protein
MIHMQRVSQVKMYAKSLFIITPNELERCMHVNRPKEFPFRLWDDRGLSKQFGLVRARRSVAHATFAPAACALVANAL